MGKKRYPFALLAALLVACSVSGGARALVVGGTQIEELVPVGHTVGIKLFCDGVIVVAVSAVNTENGEASPAAEAGLRKGDIITHVGSLKVTASEQVRQAVQCGDGVTIRLKRQGESMQLNLKPLKCAEDGSYKIGVWIRDSMAGIGTVTFYDPDGGVFGALGHGIADADTLELIPLSSGAVMRSTIDEVQKGVSGKPGELKGSFDPAADIGKVFLNSHSGIFGTLDSAALIAGKQALPLASGDEVQVGPATILSNIAGDRVESYGIEVVKIYHDANSGLKNMMVKVTDLSLLEKTGGIVQGMSGSPIIQNGRLIGAVTHVLVNDPTRGYGIFIENMLRDAYQTPELKNAA